MVSAATNVVNDLLNGGRATALITALVTFIVYRVLLYRQALKAVSYIPGFRVPFQPLGLPGAWLSTTWWNPGLNCIWLWRDTIYEHDETFSLVPYLLGGPTIYTSNLNVIRQVVAPGPNNGKNAFGKPIRFQRPVTQYGMNVLAAEGDLWRKHRRIVGPAFNNKLYEAAWAETLKTYHEMVADEGWTTKNQITVPAVQSLTFKLALLVIGKCGFGFSFRWSEPVQASTGRMTLRDAFYITSSSALITAFIPEWLQKLPLKSFRQCFKAKQALMEFMKEQVTVQKANLNSQTEDFTNVFSMLVQASEDEEGRFKLDDSELIGNVFILLLAGHETTAHSLAVTLGLLSVHSDIQEDIYQHIISVVGHERDPTYSDYDKLYKVLGAFFEGLRMFPTAHVLLREASQDTILQLPNPRGEEGTRAVPIAQGTQIIIDMVGLHSNPRYFEDPKTYKPSRWYGVSNESDAFTAFSIGNRACVGRKFATTEAVSFLTMILKDYRIEPVLDGNETTDQWKQRVLDAKLGLTMGVKDVPVTLIRRKQL